MSDLRERAAIAAYRDALKALVQYGDALVAELAKTKPNVESGPRLQCNACMGTGVPWAVITQHGYPQRCEVCGGSGYYTTPNAQPTAGACTAAERELIEATLAWNDQVWRDGGKLHRAFSAALDKVHAERRAASEAKGGVQP